MTVSLQRNPHALDTCSHSPPERKQQKKDPNQTKIIVLFSTIIQLTNKQKKSYSCSPAEWAKA